MRWTLLGATLIALAACNDGNGTPGDDDDPPIPRGRGDCGDNNPTIDQLVIEATEPDWFETNDGIQCLPVVSITITPSDVDGDLTYYKMDVWWDNVVDGRVLPEGPLSRIEGALSQDDCDVFNVPGITMRMGIAGGGVTSPSFDFDTEFGVVVYDDVNNASEDGTPTVGNVVTPSAVVESDCPPR